MKFSLITPEHNPKNIFNLLELFESIKAQTYTNWEWVLYLNNGWAMITGRIYINDVLKKSANGNQVTLQYP